MSKRISLHELAIQLYTEAYGGGIKLNTSQEDTHSDYYKFLVAAERLDPLYHVSRVEDTTLVRMECSSCKDHYLIEEPLDGDVWICLACRPMRDNSQ